MTSRLNIYLLVDHGIRIQGRSLASWQVVGQVEPDRCLSEIAGRKLGSPSSMFSTGKRPPDLPYGYTALSVKYAKGDASATSYRQGMDDA